MRRSFIVAAALCVCTAAFAQSKPKIDWPDYKFSTDLENPITPVKNQHRSGTCWAYSTIGFVESEIIRINGIENPEQYPDLSEFFVVSHSYADRAEKYIRLDGNLTFSAGSEADDVLDVIRDYGIVPQEAMTGMNYGTELPVQGEMDAVLYAYVQAVASNPNKTLTTAWQRGYNAILAEYLGKYPETFTVDGVEYTPESYRDALGFKPDEYITLTSFTHHPFYSWFAIEVCDNWRWDEALNVPVDEMMSILDAALENGYTAAWGADVSQPGFTRDGLGVLVDIEMTNNSGSDRERWTGAAEQAPKGKAGKIVELVPTQETRQTDFDNKTVTDDHGMQIFGIAHDQFGKKYYMVKNSWGLTGKYDGIWYITESFVKQQTIDIVLHKSALSGEFVSEHNIK
ncbi:MAG: aminopeptidase [Bacteroidales bacterium]|nr:aminopeptidase [Candidatus Cryptobacteroides aphodequi]